MENGLYRIEKKSLKNLLANEKFYITIDGTDVAIEKRVYNRLKEGEEVCVISPSIFYERRGVPLLVKEL